ncbi:MAG: Bacterial alpha-L-rhamnosidase [Cyclobacteriaceae bacterium]|nr:MAG: Bacterial alpha-L-rhamnosidase [Cyclobacteriaceae bacterium]
MKYLILCTLFSFNLYAQDFYTPEQRAAWLSKAERFKPKLTERVVKPVQIVSIVADPNVFQGWKATKSGSLKDFYENSFKTQSGTIFDFGDHLTGHFSLSIKELRGVMDGPLRLKLTFGEVPAEVVTPFDPYTGSLSRAWLQDEIITVDDISVPIKVNRRIAFRYLKIELLGSSPYFDFAINDMQFVATTSVATQPEPLATTTEKLVQDIDRIGLATLRECMQTVYEDGPKRDQRLWLGDLYLESLANNFSFKNHDLTRRCLYLMAGVSKTTGYLNHTLFEGPKPHGQDGAPFLFEYSLLFNVTLKEFLIQSGDRQTAEDLWPVAKKQLENITVHLNEQGLLNAEAASKARWWLFVDWNDKLDKQTSVQGIMIFALKHTYELAKALGKEKELAHVPALIKKLTDAARKNLYDKKLGLFISGPSRQISYASQAWMVLSGVASQTEGQKALLAVQTNLVAVRPGAPYLVHYFIEAMIQSGLKKEAREMLVEYWGGMVKKGADTFWEVYDPKNDQLSPYNFFPMNSYCHAWSCTPVYFIRKYPDIFQK